MAQVLIHPLAGVLSAVGIGLADRSVVREATVGLPLGDEALDGALAELRAAAIAGLAEQGVDPAAVRLTVLAQLRYARNDQTIGVAWDDPEVMAAAFAEAHRQRFGFVGEDALVVEQLRVEAIAGGEAQDLPTPLLAERTADPVDRVAMYLAASGMRCRSIAARGWRPVRCWRGRCSSSIRCRPWWSSPAGRRACCPRGRCCWSGSRRGESRRWRSGRSRSAGNLRRAVHGHRRGNGRSASAERGVGQYPGAAGFLLRHLRRGRRAGRQCAAYPGSPGVDG